MICIAKFWSNLRERPYQHDSTASRLLSEVKHVRAWLVLRWGTTLESQVLFSFFVFIWYFLLFWESIYFSSSSSIYYLIYLSDLIPPTVSWTTPLSWTLHTVLTITTTLHILFSSYNNSPQKWSKSGDWWCLRHRIES